MWRVDLSTSFRLSHLSGLAITVFAIVVAVASVAETVLFERTGSSASITGRAPVYAFDAFHFSDIDGDGEEEFISIEFTETYPKESIATVSRWQGDGRRLVEWTTGPLEGRRRLLVGNVDDDPLDEMVLFGFGYLARQRGPRLIVAGWDGSNYEILPSAALSGRVGALVDVDGDGINEIVVAKIRVLLPEGEGTDPITLIVCRVSEEGFEPMFEHHLAFGVKALVAGDVDGDGRDEFITVENSHSGHVRGQVSIYRVDTDRGIELIFRENRLVDSVRFLRVFSSGGERYLFVEGSSDLWKAVFRIEALPQGYELIPQSANQPDVFRDALRSTMTFSAERGAMVRYIDRRMLEFVPVASP